MTRSFAAALSVGMLMLGVGGVYAQPYPNKTIRLVSPEVGSGTDATARIVAPAISVPLGQSVIVENRGGNLSGETVARGNPDGYTLLVAGSSFWVGPLLRQAPYDPVKDFAPVTWMTSSPSVLVVHPAVPVKSVRELIALARARPGELNFAAGAIGGAPHLAGELFKFMAGINIVRVSYKGTGPAGNAVLGGEVQMMFGSAALTTPHMKSGRMRGLAVGSPEPSALAPGLPTVASSGLPGYEAGTENGVFAPAGTQAAIIQRLNQEIVQVLNRADVKERLFNAGIEVAGTSPAGLAAKVKNDMANMGKMIREAGIRLD